MDYSSEIIDPHARPGVGFDVSGADILDLDLRGSVEKDFQMEPFDVEKELLPMSFAADEEAREAWAAERRPEGTVDEQSEFFKKREGMTEVARGVFMKSVHKGFGPKVEPGFLVYVHYKIEQDGCSCPVDDSSKHDLGYGQPRPWIFRVGTGTVIPCLDTIVLNMRQGEMVEAFVMPNAAYNTVSKDNPLTNARIKKEQPIFATLTLTDIIANREAREVYDMSENELKKADFGKIYLAVIQQKESGNDYNTKKQYVEAHGRYKLAVDWLLTRNPETVPEDEAKKRDLVALLFTNMAIVNLSGQYPKGAKKFAVEAIKYADSPARKVKAFYNAARACFVLNQFEEALGHVREGLKVERTRALVDEEDLILEKLKRVKLEEAEMYRKMFNAGPLECGEKEGEEKSDEYLMDEGVKEFIVEALTNFVLDPKESSMAVPNIGLNPFHLGFMETKAEQLGLKCLHDDFNSLVAVEKPEGYQPPV